MTRWDLVLKQCAVTLRRDRGYFSFDSWQTTGLKYEVDEVLAELLLAHPVAGVAFKHNVGASGMTTVMIKVTRELDLDGLDRLAELVAIAQSTDALERLP